MSELRSLDWDLILKKIEDCATSLSGKEKVRLTKPLDSAEEASRQFAEIEAAFEVISSGVRPHAQSLDLFDNWIIRLRKKGVLKTIELKDVRAFCLESIALKETLKNFESSWAVDMRSQMMKAEEPLSAIDQILTPQGDIRSDASETLYRLHNEKERLARDVKQSLDRLVKDHQLENMLQDKYVTTREGRWVVPVRSGMQHFVPGVIHGSSQTKQTVFMEPEKVIPMNNRLRQIEVEVEDEIERLLTELAKYLHRQTSGLETTRDLMEKADILLAQAQFSSLIQGNPVKFSDTLISLEEVRHPILQMSGKTVIPNTVKLDQNKKILMLSGPNAGGKTVLLKSIGLSAQMARCGLPICAAPGSEIPFFKEIIIGIGDSQSVDEDLSTFAAHLRILDLAAQKKGPQILILVDEMCGSTDPEEGSALARAFIEEYERNDVFAIITSHLSPLKTGWTAESKVLNGSLEFSSIQGRPTYQFLPGIPGDSLAIQTAKRVGVSSGVIETAIHYLSPVSKKRLESLNEVEKLKQDLMDLQKTWKNEAHQAQALRHEFESKLKKFENEKDRMLDKEVKRAEKKVEEAISKAQVQDTFRKYRDLSEIKNDLPGIIKATPFAMESKITSADDFAVRFPPGTKVHVSALNQDGIIQSKPNAKGEVLILSNSIRLQLPWFELKPAGHPQSPTAKIVRQSTGFTASMVDADKTLDLRGKTVEGALEDLEMALDSAFTQKEERMKIIHGHGTEALKKSVRTYLSRSVYVKKWKSGSSEQGGDGITWVEIGE